MSESIFVKSVLYREVLSGKFFAVLLFRDSTEKTRVDVEFLYTPDFVIDLSRRGVQVTRFLNSSSVDTFLKRNGCEFVKRLPISPGTDAYDAMHISDIYKKVFKSLSK